MTASEYLVLERAAETRSEFVDGRVIPMPLGGWWVGLIKSNIICALGNAFERGPCYTLSSDMRTKVSATSSYFYPDIIVMCGRAELEDEWEDSLLNPQVLIEVFSPKSEAYDRGEKFRHYRRLPSVREYFLVSQSEPLIDRFVRLSNDAWEYRSVEGMNATISLASVDAKLDLAEIYDEIEFPPQLTGLLDGGKD